MNLSDRIALFNNGRIEQVGSPEELYRAPETLFTARFLGDSNVFDLGAGAARRHSGLGGPRPGRSRRARSPATRACSRTARSSCAPRTSASCATRPPCRRARTRSPPPCATSSTWAPTAQRCSRSAAAAQPGRARIDALDSTLALGDQVVAWWKPERQRVVAA